MRFVLLDIRKINFIEAVHIFFWLFEFHIYCENVRKTHCELFTEEHFVVISFCNLSLQFMRQNKLITFTYEPRCHNNVFTNFEKLIDVNLLNDMFFLIFVFQVNPRRSRYTLQSLQRKPFFWFFALKVSSVSEFFISFQKIFQLSELKVKLIESPYLTEYSSSVQKFITF